MTNASTIVTDSRVKISHRIERLPSSKYQMLLAGLILLGWFVEAIDLGGISFLFPALAKEFKLDAATLGFVGSMSFVGMFLGSAISGGLSDKFGRKKMLIVSMIFWGISGVLLANSPSITWLIIFRFMLGVGLGAQSPVAISTVSEFVSSKSRGKYLTAYQIFLPLGIATAGLLTYLLLPKMGWRFVFIAEAVPSLWALVIWKYMPESPMWLESKGRMTEADGVMEYIEKKVEISTGHSLPPVQQPKAVLVEQATVKGSSFWQIWSKPYLATTIMCSIWWFSALLGYYGLSTWLSALLVAKGFSVLKSIGYVSLITLGGVPAYFLITYLVERIGRKWTVVAMAILTAVTAYFYGISSTIVLVIITGLLFQFIQYGYAMANTVYLPELYPTAIRGTGVGFATAMGRIGAMIGPLAIGYILKSYGSTAVFVFAAGVNILGGLIVAVLGTETKGKVF
ncbi:MAG: MFS transporter [Desulfitobacteriaceae bacterium]